MVWEQSGSQQQRESHRLREMSHWQFSWSKWNFSRLLKRGLLGTVADREGKAYPRLVYNRVRYWIKLAFIKFHYYTQNEHYWKFHGYSDIL
jgi:hypothetical protein